MASGPKECFEKRNANHAKCQLTVSFRPKRILFDEAVFTSLNDKTLVQIFIVRLNGRAFN